MTARPDSRWRLLIAGIVIWAGCVTAPGGTAATISIVPHFEAKERQELSRLLELAKRAPAPEREQRWFDVASFAVQHARSTSGAPGVDAPEIVAALKEACPRLPAASLAAVAARTPHPIVSEAYCRTLMRGKGPTGIPAAAEAAAEARDALVRFGPLRSASSVEFVKRVEHAASGAGGAQRSVYRILVIGEGGPLDSTSLGSRVRLGMQSAIDAAAGPLASRFRLAERPASSSEMFSSVEMEGLLGRFTSAGVVVVTGSSSQVQIAASLSRVRGFVLADGRSPVEVERTIESEYLQYAGMSFFSLGNRLEYRHVRGDNEFIPPAEDAAFEALQLRPTSYERGRRLAMFVASRPEITKVAIASPEHGADAALGRGFSDALRALGRERIQLDYAPGRRPYTAEAERFVASGAQAILFAGAGEESGEWLSALAKRNVHPVVLGTLELAPEGFHASQRAALEGAILAGEDWEDRNPDLVARLMALGEPAMDPDFRRGYRFGWTVARAIVEGAYTPTSLKRVLETRALPQDAGHLGRVLVGIQQGDANMPVEVVVPLHTVKNGVAVALPGF